MTVYAFERAIVYDRESRDYAIYLDKELMGFARTYQEAETMLDELVRQFLKSGLLTAAATNEPTTVAAPVAYQ